VPRLCTLPTPSWRDAGHSPPMTSVTSDSTTYPSGHRRSRWFSLSAFSVSWKPEGPSYDGWTRVGVISHAPFGGQPGPKWPREPRTEVMAERHPEKMLAMTNCTFPGMRQYARRPPAMIFLFVGAGSLEIKKHCLLFNLGLSFDFSRSERDWQLTQNGRIRLHYLA